MLELDYMLIADYVRADNGRVHIMSAGIDTVFTPMVPTVQPLGIAVRIFFDNLEEVGAEHHLSIAFQTADGARLLQAVSTFSTPPRPAGVPDHWRTSAGIAIQIPVPLPDYGDYSFELDIDDGDVTKSIDIRVIQPPGASGATAA